LRTDGIDFGAEVAGTQGQPIAAFVRHVRMFPASSLMSEF
jgi:hypothetical protein